MPGRLRSSFRSGNLAEHLGLLLLKGVAAVAEVSRPEDVGLDAIATLLRRDEDGNCYAEHAFVVQLKSASEKTLNYRHHEVAWLTGQAHPMFIGVVSLAKAQISLYPTLFICQAIMSLHATHTTVRFGRSGLAPGLHGQTWFPWRDDPDHGARVWLGEPLLQWTLGDLVNPTWMKASYETLHAFLAIARRELELLSIGQFSVIDWVTNDVNSIKAQPGFMRGHPDELKVLADRSAPYLQALMLNASSLRDGTGIALRNSLVALAASLRAIGAEIDPDDLFRKLLWLSQNQPTPEEPNPDA